MASNARMLTRPLAVALPEAFSQPEKLLGAYFSSSTVGLCILDSTLRYVAVNKTLADMNGIAIAAHLGKTVREVTGQLADLVEPHLHRVFETGEPVLNFEVSGSVPHGAQGGYWVDHFFPIRDAHGAVTQVGVVVLDVTEQRRLKESLDDTNRKLHKQMSHLQMLLDISSILSSRWDLQQLFPRISARIRRVFRQEYAAFSMHDSMSGTAFGQVEDFPLSKGLTREVPINSANSPSACALEQGSPLIFSCEQMQACDAEIAKKYLAEGLQSLCCVPLLRPQGPLGVLALGSTRKHAFHLEDVALLNQIAAQFAVALENHQAAAEIETLKQRLTEEKKYLEGEIRPQAELSEIVGESVAIKQVLDQVQTVAASDATVLILGETGTGKELVARGIHQLSRRNDCAFIKVNCAAIPTGLLESELFGHEKGAFTGAVSQKVGRIELADGGTLFLDEIGEIPLELQPKLLRVLQDQEFERLGSTRTIKVNIRLVAATNRDLARSVVDREFRSDLFYRLHVFPIKVPALRDRVEDIPLLVRYFVHRFARRMNRQIESIPKETMNVLTAWPWPGNVRELENLMERSVILSEGSSLRVPLSEMRQPPGPISTSDRSLGNAERSHIIRILRETGGILSGPHGAARRLGLKRTTLQSKMQRLGISSQDYSTPPTPNP
jgi:formate hydrogenlyase transcriptional activator